MGENDAQQKVESPRLLLVEVDLVDHHPRALQLVNEVTQWQGVESERVDDGRPSLSELSGSDSFGRLRYGSAFRSLQTGR
jgi:hypothetical protein